MVGKSMKGRAVAGRDWGQEEKGTTDSMGELREKLMDRQASAIHGVAKSQTRLSN